MKRPDPRDFRVKPGATVDLREWPTVMKHASDIKKHYDDLLQEHLEKLNDLQTRLYASNSWSLLLILQGMDAAGKDSTIKHVMSGVNPQGCEVFSFKQPSAEELQHDFLWRAVRRLPERGRIGVFNRSYYEEVLVVRVHPELLRNQHLPPELLDEKRIWDQRYRSMVHLEDHLERNGTCIIKVFLHISKEEQRQRLLKRLEEPKKKWKLTLADVQERAYWNRYRKAYEACLSATSTAAGPWYVVPADDKPLAWLIVSQVVIDTLESLNLKYPKPTTRAGRQELHEIRKLLEQ